MRLQPGGAATVALLLGIAAVGGAAIPVVGHSGLAPAGPSASSHDTLDSPGQDHRAAASRSTPPGPILRPTPTATPTPTPTHTATPTSARTPTGTDTATQTAATQPTSTATTSSTATTADARRATATPRQPPGSTASQSDEPASTRRTTGTTAASTPASTTEGEPPERDRNREDSGGGPGVDSPLLVGLGGAVVVCSAALAAREFRP